MTVENINGTYGDNGQSVTLTSHPNRNPHYHKSPLEHVVAFTGSAIGVFRTLQVVEKVLKVASMIFDKMGHHLALPANELSKNIKMVSGFLAIPDLFRAQQDILTAVNKLPDLPTSCVSRSHHICSNAKTIADGAGTVYVALAAVSGNAEFWNRASVMDFMKNMFEIVPLVEDYGRLQQLSRKCNKVHGVHQSVHERVNDTMRLKMMSIAKVVISIASGALSLLALSLGGPLLPAVALLALSVTGTVLAILTHFYKETMEFRPIDFTKFKNSYVV